VLARHALNSPGALITNVSLPTEAGDALGRDLIAKLVACYLYPKQFIEGEEGKIPEGPIARGHDVDEWLDIVSSDLENYYGQFVTRIHGGEWALHADTCAHALRIFSLGCNQSRRKIMASEDQGAVWGTVMLAGAQMVEWKIEGGDDEVSGTDLRGFFREMVEQSVGKEAAIRVSFLVKY